MNQHEKIKEKVLKELSKWHLMVYDLFEERTTIDEWFDTKEEAKQYLKDEGFVDKKENYEWWLKYESPSNLNEFLDLAISKTQTMMIEEFNELLDEVCSNPCRPSAIQTNIKMAIKKELKEMAK